MWDFGSMLKTPTSIKIPSEANQNQVVTGVIKDNFNTVEDTSLNQTVTVQTTTTDKKSNEKVYDTSNGYIGIYGKVISDQNASISRVNSKVEFDGVFDNSNENFGSILNMHVMIEPEYVAVYAKVDIVDDNLVDKFQITRCYETLFNQTTNGKEYEFAIWLETKYVNFLVNDGNVTKYSRCNVGNNMEGQPLIDGASLNDTNRTARLRSRAFGVESGTNAVSTILSEFNYITGIK